MHGSCALIETFFLDSLLWFVLSYIKASLGGPTPTEHEAVVAQRESLKARVSQLEQELEAAKAKITQLEHKIS
jgi:hypothetical protein